MKAEKANQYVLLGVLEEGMGNPLSVGVSVMCATRVYMCLRVADFGYG